MATLSQWVEGARPRTLPAAVAPVLVGTGAAFALSRANAANALLALLVSLALQVGVNYANDYSDGIRGTDADRVGPLRLVGSGAASAGSVRLAAFASFGVAVLAGLVLAATTSWWLVPVGALAVLAAWFYTGGSMPYGYRALGEVMVFLFFGLVAVAGSYYVQTERVTWEAFVLAVPVGLLAAAILVVNNVRDLETDRRAGKRTLAVRLGRPRTRTIFGLMVYLAFVTVPLPWVLGALSPWLLLPWLLFPAGVMLVRLVRTHTDGPTLNRALAHTGMLQLGFCVLLSVGLLLS